MNLGDLEQSETLLTIPYWLYIRQFTEIQCRFSACERRNLHPNSQLLDPSEQLLMIFMEAVPGRVSFGHYEYAEKFSVCGWSSLDFRHNLHLVQHLHYTSKL